MQQRCIHELKIIHVSDYSYRKLTKYDSMQTSLKITGNKGHAGTNKNKNKQYNEYKQLYINSASVCHMARILEVKSLISSCWQYYQWIKKN